MLKLKISNELISQTLKSDRGCAMFERMLQGGKVANAVLTECCC